MREGTWPILCDILYQGSAESDIHDLDSAADGECRQSHRFGRVNERYLGLIPGPAQSANLVSGGRSIEGGIYVSSAREEEAVNAIERWASRKGVVDGR